MPQAAAVAAWAAQDATAGGPDSQPNALLGTTLCPTEPVQPEAMANLTLAIDDALLQRAREAALREHTSVNAPVRNFLGRHIEARSRWLDALEQFEAVATGSPSASQQPWSRESLHERV